MASRAAEIGGFALTEIIEQKARRVLINRMKSDIGKRLSAPKIARGGLLALMDPQGEFVQSLPPAIKNSPSEIAAVLAALIKKGGFLEKIPDNGRSDIKMAKWILSEILPALTISAGEAYEEAINHHIDAAISDPTVVPEKQRFRPLDRPIRLKRGLLPGRVFFPQARADGTLIEIDGVPAVDDETWRTVVALCQTMNIRDFWEYITPEIAADMVSTGAMHSADMVALAAALRADTEAKAAAAAHAPPPPAARKSPYLSIDPEAWEVYEALAGTASRLSVLEQNEAEGLIKDLFAGKDGNFDPVRVNMLKRHHAHIVPGEVPTFTREKFFHILTIIDQALGGERGVVDKGRRLLSQFKLRSATGGMRSALGWLWTVAKWSLIFGGLGLVAFLVSVWYFVEGYFGSATVPMGEVPKLEDLLRAAHQNCRYMTIGTVGMFLTIGLSRFLDLPLNLVAGLLRIERDKITNIGRLLSAVIGAIGMIAVIMTVAPFGFKTVMAFWPFWGLSAILGSIGFKLWLQADGFPGESRIWTLKSATTGKWLSTAMIAVMILLAVIACFQASGMDPAELSKGTLGFFRTDPSIAGLMLVMLFLGAVYLVYKYPNKERPIHWALWVLLFIAVIIVFLAPRNRSQDWQAERDAPVTASNSSSLFSFGGNSPPPAPVSQASQRGPFTVAVPPGLPTTLPAQAHLPPATVGFSGASGVRATRSCSSAPTFRMQKELRDRGLCVD